MEIYILLYLLLGIIIGLIGSYIFNLIGIDTLKAMLTWPIVLVALILKLIRTIIFDLKHCS